MFRLLDPKDPEYKKDFEERLRIESERITLREIRELAEKEIRAKFFEDDKFVVMRFVEFLMENFVLGYFVTPKTLSGGDIIWVYDEDRGIYDNTGIAWLEQVIQTVLEEECTVPRVKAIVKLVKIRTYTKPKHFQPNPDIVVLKNGTLNIKTNKFRGFNPIYNAKAQLPVTYDPEAECPLFLKFLDEIIPDQKEFYQEWLGYHFLNDYRYQRCVILVGDGDNGKSTLLNVQTALLGSENVASLSLFKLSTNRFAVAELDSKVANIAADIGPDELRHTGTIKMLTGGDWINVERKNKDPFQMKNTAKLTFSCNQLPRTPDETRAFFKRFIIVTFDKVIPKEEQDSTLLDKLTTETELSGILNWALQGLQKALERGQLIENADHEERKEQYMTMSDPVNGFISAHINENYDSHVEKQELIRAFHNYCMRKGFVPLSDRKFIELFKKNVYVRESRITKKTPENLEGTRVRVWKGIELIGEIARKPPDNPEVQYPQTQLNKYEKKKEYVDLGQMGCNGQERL